MCLQNIIGNSAKLWALGPGQSFDNTFWILLLQLRRQRRLWRQLQTNQTHIGPTLYVGPNYIAYNVVEVLQTYFVSLFKSYNFLT